MDDLSRIVIETLQKQKQALVFLPSRASAEKTAEELSKLTTENLPEIEKAILQAVSTPTKQCRRLSHCLKKGIAFHHSGLVSAQREIIEQQFRRGTIKVICCTPTLAAGISTPAYRVLIKSLKRYSGTWGMDWIPVLEYLQMAGRAGRPEFGDKMGEAIVLARDQAEKEEIYERYLCGLPEDISSKLAVEPVLRTYLLALISSGVIRDHKSMMKFFAQTFWAYQFEDLPKLRVILDRMLASLQQWKFVEGVENISSEFVPASTLHALKFRPTLLGKRISELYLDPLTAKHLLDCLENHDHQNDHQKTAFSLLQMVAHTLEMRPLLSVKAKEQEKIQEEITKRLDLLLEPEPSPFDLEYADFINSVKTALFFEGWISEYDEEYLLETFDIRPGEIRGKIESADWLLYAAEELAKIQQLREAMHDLVKLRIRVQQGIKEELLPLIQLRGIGRIRSRKLFSHGIKNLGDIKKSDITTLTQLLGKALAEDVKKQVGEEIQEVPEGKRKGQVSLKKF